MFQFGRFPSYTYGFSVWCMGLTPYGLLHSDICGSIRACQSPQLFAAYRVLRRLPMPRHPPCALISLTSFQPISQLFPLVWIMLLFRLKFFEIVVSLLTLLSIWKLKLFPHCIYFTSLFNFQDSNLSSISACGGHKWTRTIDLTLIRRAL